MAANEPQAADPGGAAVRLSISQPAPVGNPGVLTDLKRRLGISVAEDFGPTTPIEPDQFPLAERSPLRDAHLGLSEVLRKLSRGRQYTMPEVTHREASEWTAKLTPGEAENLLPAAAERHAFALLAAPVVFYGGDQTVVQARFASSGIVFGLARRKLAVDRPFLFDLLLSLSLGAVPDETLLEKLLDDVERFASESPPTPGERFVLALVRSSLISTPPMGTSSPTEVRLSRWIGDGTAFLLVPGEAWSDAVNRDYSEVPEAQRRPWAELFAHVSKATSSRPSAKWLKTGRHLIDACGEEKFAAGLTRWLSLVPQGRSSMISGSSGADTMTDGNADCLRGLLWLAPLLPPEKELLRRIGAAAASAYKKIPGIGPRAVKVGNGAVYALSQVGTPDAVGQLAVLKVRVKFGSAQKEIEKAFQAAAAALGLPRDRIEEMGVPSYGLDPGGTHTEILGEHTATLTVTGADARLAWTDAKGKTLKSVPARVKSEFKEELKELQQSLKDIQAMLPAQRDRLDSLFLQRRTWAYADWQESYLEHPLVGTIARRLIWCVDDTPVLFFDGTPTDVDGRAVPHGRTAEIGLWHPVGRDVQEVVAWRRRLEDMGVTQPFKQAHREVYLLTDAERRTDTYSNRFAAHVLRQHQFNALCAARGWKNKLRLLVDDVYPPAMKELPDWGLRAEFWIEGIGDDYGTDTNDAGVFLRLSTDQVRFYAVDAAENLAHAGGGGYESRAWGPGREGINEPLRLETIPPLAFSETMRDVDLFVGVSSVGNDPTWQDGGPEGRFRDYWHTYSFGELSGTAGTRKHVLERLIPRLKIAKRCSFNDRFLVVRGDLRTYKIHLGSGNILMEPNDQYLCIVPDAKNRAKQDELFLPFEGDAMLSIILSKAFLLAEDAKIKDPTITRQLELR